MTNEWHMRIRVGFMLDRANSSTPVTVQTREIRHTDAQVHNESLRCPNRRNNTETEADEGEELLVWQPHSPHVSWIRLVHQELIPAPWIGFAGE
jgi:hypothetical protein